VPDYWSYSVEIAKAWEAAQRSAATPLTRKVALRTAMVMSPGRGGIFHVLRGMIRQGQALIPSCRSALGRQAERGGDAPRHPGPQLTLRADAVGSDKQPGARLPAAHHHRLGMVARQE
jgi:hypothetical protein